MMRLTRVDEMARTKQKTHRYFFQVSVVLFFLECLCGIPTQVLADQHGATVAGRVLFKGSPSVETVVKVTEDTDFCGTTMAIRNLTVHPENDGLHQAVISIQGLQGKTDGVEPPPVIVNQHCAFLPRVSVGAKGHKLAIQNKDPILHNTHAKLGRRTLTNVAQVPGGRTIRKTMRRPGIIEVQCDKHKFMKGFLLIFDHPYFAVTNMVGEFQISGVPSGQHTLTVWHETLGVLEKQITVPAEGIVSVQFEYH